MRAKAPRAAPFPLELLPDGARDAIFRALSREDAAAACCVSRAWHRAFCSGARRLWAELDFQPPFFEAAVTKRLVRAAAAKARDKLRAVTLHDPALAAIVPALLTAHPKLARVRFACEAPLSWPHLCAALSFGHPLAELRCAVIATLPDLPLLHHAALRVQRLDVVDTLQPGADEAAAQVLAVAAALRAHAPSLEAVELAGLLWRPQPHAERVRLPDAAAAPLTDALAACTAVSVLSLPAGLLSAASFEALAAAREGAQTPIRSFWVDGADAEAHLPCAVRSLLPGLERLSMGACPLAAEPAVLALAAALGGNTRLHRASLCSPSCGAAALLGALAATQLRWLHVRMTWQDTPATQAQEGADLAAMAAALGSLRSLRSLKLERTSGSDAAWRAHRRALLAAVGSLPALRTLLLGLVGDIDREADGVYANELLRADAAPALRSLTLGGDDCALRGGSAIASALAGNASLTELTLRAAADDAALRALGAALAANSTLRSLTLSAHFQHAAVGPGALHALAAGLKANRTLTDFTLSIGATKRAGERNIFRCGGAPLEDAARELQKCVLGSRARTVTVEVSATQLW